MADSSPEPIGSVQAAFNYGQITLEVLAPQHRTMASQEQLDHLLQVAAKRMQDKVVPKVERLVEEDGGRIGEASHAEADHDVHLPSATLSARADCEMVADVSESTEAEVKQVLRQELLEPLDELFRRKAQRQEDAQKARFVIAVRSVMGDLKGRVN